METESDLEELEEDIQARNDIICLRCYGKHKFFDCKSKNKNKCINCAYFNYKFQKNYKTEHACYDLEKCESLKNLIKKVTNFIDYPVEPKIDPRMIFILYLYVY